jgi:O-6-methylguanine DNA methyltransferase
LANKKREVIKIFGFKKIAFPPLAGSAIGVIGDNSKVRFSVVRKVLYTFLHHKNLTPFAKKVYKAVLSIPIGEVRSYKWVAQKTGKPHATRAVGQILKHNPWPLIIPCHRVVCANGKLGGYARGEKKKKTLLDLEKQIRKDMV